MQATVETSPLLQERLRVVPKRMVDISTAIEARDFDSFAQITMADSNQFHAVCLDTTPPIFYLNDTSRAIIALVQELNRASVEANGSYLAAYTFDAGPNAVIYAPKENMPTVIAAVNKYFPQATEFADPFKMGTSAALPEGFNEGVVNGGWEKGAVKQLIHTQVGDGPRRLDDAESLLNAEGVPKVLA